MKTVFILTIGFWAAITLIMIAVYLIFYRDQNKENDDDRRI